MFVIKKQIIKVSKDFQDTRIDYWLKKNYPTFHYFFFVQTNKERSSENQWKKV